MNEGLDDGVTLELHFAAHGVDGVVTVGLRTLGDGREVGFDVLDGLPFGPEAVAGFPAVQATVAYAGAGYRATMAWIQVLTIDRFPASGSPSRWTGVDLPPALDGLGAPFGATTRRATAPALHPLTPCSGDAWSSHLGLLCRDFPAWRFGPEPQQPAT